MSLRNILFRALKLAEQLRLNLYHFKFSTNSYDNILFRALKLAEQLRLNLYHFKFSTNSYDNYKLLSLLY